ALSPLLGGAMVFIDGVGGAGVVAVSLGLGAILAGSGFRFCCGERRVATNITNARRMSTTATIARAKMGWRTRLKIRLKEDVLGSYAHVRAADCRRRVSDSLSGMLARWWMMIAGMLPVRPMSRLESAAARSATHA